MNQGKGGFASRRDGENLILTVTGEIDHHSAVRIRADMDALILEARPERTVIDLSEVDFMDSSGLGLIMGRFALQKRCGGTLAVLDPSPAVMKMIKLAGMDRMLSILKTKVKGNETE